MGFTQKRKRQKKAGAMSSAQSSARASGSSSSAWWLTIAVKTTCCARCGAIKRKGSEIVFRKAPQETRCLPCAEDLPFRPSVAWERARLTSKSRARRNAPSSSEPTQDRLGDAAAAHRPGSAYDPTGPWA